MAPATHTTPATFQVIYGSYTLNTQWVIATYTTITEALARFDSLSSIRHSDEWVSIHTEWAN